MDVKCPLCGFINEFGVRPNPENLEVDKEGYWLDLAGDRVMIYIFDKTGEKNWKQAYACSFWEEV